MKPIVKVKCGICHHKMATWEYIPRDFEYYCDDCVPRGCSCNINEKTNEEFTDEIGRLLPCCEFDYSQNGWTANFLLNKVMTNPKWVHIFTHKTLSGHVIWNSVYKYYR